MATKDTESGFLSRWSRRKLERKETGAPPAEERGDDGAREDEVPAPVPAGSSAPEEDRAGEPTAPELTEEDVEKLEPGSDYTVFMKKGVAAHIQRLALRKLWLSDPVLANLDGLVDYADDYRAEAAASLGRVSSSWKAGGGYARDEDAADAEGEAPPADAARDEPDAVQAAEAETEADAAEDMPGEDAPAGEAEEAARATPGAEDGDDDEKT